MTCTTRSPSGSRLNAVPDLSQQLGYQFEDPGLLELALSHRSAGSSNNERLEFLGDAVLDAVISAELVSRFPEADEGQLSRMRAHLVSGVSLAAMATEFGLPSHIRVGASEQPQRANRQRRSLLADTLEALVGAIYTDAGYLRCEQVVLAWFEQHLQAVRPDDVALKDPKTRLQEWLQARGEPLPEYAVESASGPQHHQRFTVSCRIERFSAPVLAEGSSVKRAEQNAAEQVLNRVTGDNA